MLFLEIMGDAIITAYITLLNKLPYITPVIQWHALLFVSV